MRRRLVPVVLVTILFSALTATAQQLDRLMAIQSRVEGALLARPGIRGIGIAKEGEQLVFLVYVTRDFRVSVPTQLEGVPVRTKPIGPITALGAWMGTSTSNNNGCGAGTLGLRVVDNSNPALTGYVTNNHVAAKGGLAGCANEAPLGAPQYSPGMLDNDCKLATKIGALHRFIPIDFAPTAANRVDAAFVVQLPDATSELTDCGLCFAPTNPLSLNAALLNMPVRKCGRTTHLTTGTVQAINTTTTVDFKCGKKATFVKQIAITAGSPFSHEGDSGSAVYGPAGIVGLLFAGDQSGLTTYVNPIGDVLSLLGVTPGNGTPTSCTTSGTDSTAGGGGIPFAPRLYPSPNGKEMLVALAGGTLLKFRTPGGSGHNLFGIEKSNGVFTSATCYDYLLGSQRLPAEIRDVDFIGSVTLVGLSDGRIVKVDGTGGTGPNMFGIDVAPGGFTRTGNYPYYLGSHRFSSGIADVTAVGGETLVSLDDGRMIKVNGTGGTGFNLFGVIDAGNAFNNAGYPYLVGDQNLGSPITAVAFIGGQLIVATANGKLLKVAATGGTGNNMFGVIPAPFGYIALPYPYYVGDQMFKSPVTRIFAAPSETIFALADGRLLKVNGSGGTGKNMLAVNDDVHSFSRTGNYPYYVGDARMSAPATAFAFISNQLLIGFANGKMLKVTGTGGTGHNMFAVQETANGFAAVPNPTQYLIGSTYLAAPIADVASIAGFTWVGVGNGKVMKINGTGGTGFNMFAVAQNAKDFETLCSYSYLAGSQGFN